MTQRRLVVGGIVVDSLAHPTTVLAGRRSRPAELAGSWEFPGGKVEADESAQQALVRELAEELSIEVEVGAELTHPDGTWPISQTYELRLFWAAIRSGVPTPGSDHDEVRLLTASTLRSVRWLAADAGALDAVAAGLRYGGSPGASPGHPGR